MDVKDSKTNSVDSKDRTITTINDNEKEEEIELKARAIAAALKVQRYSMEERIQQLDFCNLSLIQKGHGMFVQILQGHQ